MQRILVFLAIVLAGVSPALAGITVTSYSTTALTNGFAPSLQGPYFAQETLENITPALAEVSGDWIGPNADGTPDTWHFVGTSQASSTTTIGVDSYTVSAAGSFAYQIDTTTDFVDPRSSSIFSPSGAANYRGFFETDTPAMYAISVQLNQRGRVRLSSFEGATIFDETNGSTTPQFVALSGVLPPGHYQILASASLIAGNLPNGINHYSVSGSFENLIFAVQVPEPNALGVLAIIVMNVRRPHHRCLRAK